MKLQNSFIIVILSVTLSMSAQPYKYALGVKAGYSSGFMAKYISNDDLFLEGEALFNQHGFQFTGASGYQFTPYDKKRLYYYFGGGLHSGNWEDEFSFGIAAIAGAEFVFREIPLTIGAEWKPMINLFKVFDYTIPDIGLAVRITFK